jgi:hypothetical protein
MQKGSYIVFLVFVFRSKGITKMNEESSRSHFVFLLKIRGENKVCFLMMLCFMFVHKAVFTYYMFLLVDNLMCFSCFARSMGKK